MLRCFDHAFAQTAFDRVRKWTSCFLLRTVLNFGDREGAVPKRRAKSSPTDTTTSTATTATTTTTTTTTNATFSYDLV